MNIGIQITVPFDQNLSSVIDGFDLCGPVFIVKGCDVEVRVVYEGLWQSFDYTAEQLNKFLSQ